MSVEESRRFRETADRQYLWLVMYRPAGEAWAWENALHAALAGLEEDPARFSLCQDPGVQDRGLRQAPFGPRGKPTHRLIFEIDGDAVRVLTVRGFAQPDLTPDDL
ncbi:type II toxin-antitoxin system RelE/ParE family toxin [Alienimonas chondri]|uniref:Type II toxin-antitoxin system RelE/ParE family toxin n=1 Tax=Alienimonas chondri TaxID=2681879 RepID=A0ABX1VIC5_9PLAN|nr:type II toxin-antitoxin system RelE/ParE family toxin [Alienimonas chondri]NNJ27864.1 hypothetical protein [Alienimonas chondri]